MEQEYKCTGECGKMKHISAFNFIRNNHGDYRVSQCIVCQRKRERIRKSANKGNKKDKSISLAWMRIVVREIRERLMVASRLSRVATINVYYNAHTCLFTTRKTSIECEHIGTYKNIKRCHFEVTKPLIIGDMIHHIRQNKLMVTKGY